MSCGGGARRRAARPAAPRTRRAPSSASSAAPGSGPAVGRGGAAAAATPQPPPRPAQPPRRPIRPARGLFGGQLPASPRRLGLAGAGALPEERRKATVLFADLSGYTAVAERMDPEAVKSIVDRALRRLGQEVVRYGGTVDKYIGDNVMAVFGAPVSHEDDPERAVRAGLAMQAAMEEINKDIEAGRGGRRQLLAAGGDQLRRGAGRPGRRRLHGDGRRGQRRRPAAGRGAARQRHRRRDHPPPDPRPRSSTRSSSR